jgi:predicted nucleotidyltransferase
MQPMKLKNLEISIEQIKDFCDRWQITEFALFGSVLRDDFRSDSDIDVLVTFKPNAAWNLLDLVRMQQELEVIAERSVDLIEKRVIEQSSNWIRRKEILESSQVIYSQPYDIAR